MATTRGEQRYFFGKYTSLWLDTAVFTSDPWEVLPWNEVAVELFLAAADPGGPFDAHLQESHDLEVWSTIASNTINTPGTLWAHTATVRARYVRLRLDTFSPTSVPALYVLWASGVARSV